MNIPSIGAFLLYSVFTLSVVIFIISVFSLISKRFANIKIIFLLSCMICLCFFTSILDLAFLISKNTFEYKLVYEVANLSMPLHQKISGLWANQNSSLNFWCFIMCCANLIGMQIGKNHQTTEERLITVSIFFFIIIVFLVPVVFIMNPFERLWVTPAGVVESSVWISKDSFVLSPKNGIGLNPSLRHPAMMIHPPFLYMGLIGFFIPYSQAMASLAIRKTKALWAANTFNISLFSWIYLSIGILLGSWWAYTILGWGGYWGWDAVEIAGLIPWLLSTAFVHSLTSLKRKKIDNPFWPYFLVILTIIFTLIGIFITRSGVIESVHAYSKGPIGPILSIVIIAFSGISFFLLISRKKILDKEKKRYIVMSHILLLLLVLLYFLGQTLPISSTFITGARISLSQEKYELYSFPFITAIILLMLIYYLKKNIKRNRTIFYVILTGIISIVFTLISLNTFSLEFSGAILFGLDCFLIVLLGFDLITEISTFLKNKPSTVHKTSRIGSILIHLGFAILLLGILGVENGVENFIVTLGVGESKKIEKFDLIGHSSQTYVNSENRITYESSFLLKQNEEIQSILIPRIHNFENLDIVTSQPAIYYGLFRDIQLILRDWNAVNYQGSTIDILVYPLAIWIWIGGGIMVFGGILKIKNNAVLHAKSFSNHKADKSK